MASKKNTALKKPTSPVKLARDIPDATRCILWGITGGRCEFSGCNKPVYEHALTALHLNLADVAHVVAFSEEGPRGEDERPDDIHALSNLMLLCKECHKLIDDKPEKFPRDRLKAFKHEHEARIKLVTGLGPDMHTTVVQLKAKVAGRDVDIPITHVYDAVTPRWPTSQQGFVIDLTGISVDSDVGAQAAAHKINAEVRNLYAPGMDAAKTRHISLFALAPMPVLMHLGARLSDKIAIDFFQRHRDMKASPWQWRNDAQPAEFDVERVQTGTEKDKVAFVLSLSGKVSRTSLPPDIDDRFSIYEVTLKGVPPSPDFLRAREDLDRFRHLYRRFLAELVREHGVVKEMHVFPAAPAPIAVALGHDLLPKVHPDLLAYDFDKTTGGFNLKLRITRNDE